MPLHGHWTEYPIKSIFSALYHPFNFRHLVCNIRVILCNCFIYILIPSHVKNKINGQWINIFCLRWWRWWWSASHAAQYSKQADKKIEHITRYKWISCTQNVKKNRKFNRKILHTWLQIWPFKIDIKTINSLFAWICLVGGF